MERIKYHHKNVISKVDATSNTKEEDLHDERWRRDWKRSEKTYWPTAMYAYHLNRDSNSKRSWHLRQLEIWTLATDHIKEGWLIAPRSDNNVILFLKVVLTFSQIVTYLKMSGLSFKQTVRGQRKWGGSMKKDGHKLTKAEGQPQGRSVQSCLSGWSFLFIK